MHRDIFDIAEVYGKDTFVMIDKLGTDKMPMFFTLKGRMDAIFGKVPFLPSHLVDRTMQTLSHLLPSHLPKRLKEYRNRFEHHLMLKCRARALRKRARGWNPILLRPKGSFCLHGRRGSKSILTSICRCGRGNPL